MLVQLRSFEPTRFGGTISIPSFLAKDFKFESFGIESPLLWINLSPNIKFFGANPNLVKLQYEYRISDGNQKKKLWDLCWFPIWGSKIRAKWIRRVWRDKATNSSTVMARVKFCRHKPFQSFVSFFFW